MSTFFFLHQNRESLLVLALKALIVIILKRLIVRRNMTQLCGIRFRHLHCCVYSVLKNVLTHIRLFIFDIFSLLCVLFNSTVE